MSRADLLALSPESIAALANLGLVKRAQREIAEGSGPELSEDDAGLVKGLFNDGVIAELRPGKTLRETPCSCGAATVCRHRVAVALAYAGWHARKAQTSAPEPGETGSAAPLPVVERWSPSCFTDEALLAAVGKRPMERARALARKGLLVELDRADAPTARLPTCAVRFHVPRDLAYARCECAAATGCEHIVVAAWAFRQSEAMNAGSPPRTVELALAESRPAVDTSPLDELTALAALVLAEGVAGLPAQAAPRFARAREVAARAGHVWMGTLADDLELAVEAYRSQSARYRASEVAALLASIFARTRAATREAELPPRYVLGTDEARETLLDHVRLVSLGARVTADGRTRDAEVFLADPDSGVVLVLAKQWTFGEGETPDEGPALARRSIATRISFGALAAGQVVSRAVRRRANRSLVLGSSRGGATSVTPQTGAWELFPRSILAASFAELATELQAAPPKLLRPRVLADGVRVVAVTAVRDVIYDPGEQELSATLVDHEGAALRLARRHRSAAPHAIEVLAAALTGVGAPVRFVAGDVAHGRLGLTIDPVGIVTDRLHVPDIEEVSSPLVVAEGGAFRSEAPLLDALDRAASVLEEGAHLGLLRARPDWIARALEASARLTELGLTAAGARLAALGERARGLADATSDDRLREAVDAWRDAAIRVDLVRELAARGG